MLMCNSQSVVVNLIFSLSDAFLEFRLFAFKADKFSGLKYPFIPFNSSRKVFNNFCKLLNIYFTEITDLLKRKDIQRIKLFFNPSTDTANNG